MAFWTDKHGNKYTFKEFMSRWKEGIESITPLQQTKIQLRSMYLTTFGILCGLILSFFVIEKFWWLSIILAGALFNSIIMIVGMLQKKIALERIQKFMNEREVYTNE